MKTVICIWPHVWTSEGKIYEGEEATVPDEEADALKDQGSVKLKAGRKKAEVH